MCNSLGGIICNNEQTHINGKILILVVATMTTLYRLRLSSRQLS